MEFLMLTYSSKEGAAAWEGQSPEDQAAGRVAHAEWFAANSSIIRGGHELSWPRRGGVIHHKGQPKVLDGPFVESKEVLGGVIVLDAESLEQALDIASTWPSFDLYPGTRVEVIATAGD